MLIGSIWFPLVLLINTLKMLKKVKTAYTVNISRIKSGCPCWRVRSKTTAAKALPLHIPWSRGCYRSLLTHFCCRCERNLCLLLKTTQILKEILNQLPPQREITLAKQVIHNTRSWHKVVKMWPSFIMPKSYAFDVKWSHSLCTWNFCKAPWGH